MGIVIKETIRTSVVNYLGILLGVINVLWLQTSILSESQVGVIKYLFDLSFIILPFVVLGANSLPIRFIHRFKDRKSESDFLSFVLLIPLITFLIFGVLFLYFKASIYSFLGEEVLLYKSYFVYLLPLIFSHTYLLVLEGILQSRSNIFYSSLLKNVFIRLVFMIVLILYKFDIISFLDLFRLYVLGYVIELVMLFFYFRKVIKFNFPLKFSFFKNSLRNEVISYSLFLIIGSGGIVLVNRIDVIMIADLMSKYGDVFSYVGVYAVSFFIAVFIEVPKKVMAQLLFPALSQLASENKTTEMLLLYKQSALNFSIIGLFLFLMVWYNLDHLFQIIPNGEVYSKGKWVVFFIGVAKISEMIFGVSLEILIATKYYKYNLYLIPFLITITILSNYILIPIYGIVGAAIATSFTTTLYSFSRFLVVAYFLKMNSLSRNHIKVGLILGVVIIVFWLKPVLFDSSYLEIIINCIVITIVFIGGNLLLKTSIEFNSMVLKFFK